MNPTQIPIIALDPGYGNTKICVYGDTAILQSAVSHPHQVGLAAIGMKTAHLAQEVSFEQFLFAVGPEAWHWGEPHSSLDYTALAAPERRALFFATLANLLDPGEYVIDQLIVGLPVPLLQDETQAEAVFGGLKAYKGQHSFQIDSNPYDFTFKRLKVLAQPVGAYADWLLDKDLRYRRGGRKAEVAVLDLGMNTLDLYVVQGGQVAPRFVGGGKVGVRRLLELLTSNDHDVEELDAKLRQRRLRPSQPQLESWLGEVLGAFERTWPNLRRFDAVVPTGGGAVVLGDMLQRALIAKGAAVHWPEDPLTANVRGLWKWGMRRGRHR